MFCCLELLCFAVEMVGLGGIAPRVYFLLVFRRLIYSQLEGAIPEEGPRLALGEQFLMRKSAHYIALPSKSGGPPR